MLGAGLFLVQAEIAWNATCRGPAANGHPEGLIKNIADSCIGIIYPYNAIFRRMAHRAVIRTAPSISEKISESTAWRLVTVNLVHQEPGLNTDILKSLGFDIQAKAICKERIIFNIKPRRWSWHAAGKGLIIRYSTFQVIIPEPVIAREFERRFVCREGETRGQKKHCKHCEKNLLHYFVYLHV